MGSCTDTIGKTLAERLDDMAAGWLCAGLPDADLPAEAAREIERLEDELRLCCELKRTYQEQAVAAHWLKPLDYDAAHAIFDGWYHDDGGGVEFVRRVEAAHGIGA